MVVVVRQVCGGSSGGSDSIGSSDSKEVVKVVVWLDWYSNNKNSLIIII